MGFLKEDQTRNNSKNSKLKRNLRNVSLQTSISLDNIIFRVSKLQDNKQICQIAHKIIESMNMPSQKAIELGYKND